MDGRAGATRANKTRAQLAGEERKKGFGVCASLEAIEDAVDGTFVVQPFLVMTKFLWVVNHVRLLSVSSFYLV